MAKIVTIVGARPQFIKAAPVSAALKKAGIEEILVHTGQHYDPNMSDIFFAEMSLPIARHHLGVGSAPQGAQTGRMLEKIEAVLVQEKPQAVLVYGDTNSTLAGAMAAAKLGIPIAHIEAGLRSFNQTMPEEINRILTDRISQWLFCPSASARKHLQREGIRKGVVVSGDVMIDALEQFLPQSRERRILQSRNLQSKSFGLLTVHRAANTDDSKVLKVILKACVKSPLPLIFPVHPRTRDAAAQLLKDQKTIHLIEPVGYLDMLCLQENAAFILTDSGGIQKEALYLKTPCITLRDETEWTETLKNGWNRLVGASPVKIAKGFRSKPRGPAPKPYGRGAAAEKIAEVLRRSLA